LNSNFDIAGTRAESLGVMIAGGPGTGKSIVVQALCYAVAAEEFKQDEYNDFIENPRNFIYPRNTENEYWDGLTWRHYFTIFDDFGQAVDVAGQPANEFFEWIRAVNPFEWRVHKAGMEEKGLITFNSKMVIGNTNTHIFKARSINEIKALERRFNVHVICMPKLEYTTSDTVLNDVWNRKFDISKLPVHPVTGKKRFDYTCQSFQYIDRLGNPIGEEFDFHELVRVCVAGIRERQAWKEDNQGMLEELANTYRFKEPGEVPVIEMMPMERLLQKHVVPQGAPPFGKLSIAEFNAMATNEVLEFKLNDKKKESQDFAIKWLTLWQPLLVRFPEFFSSLDSLVDLMGGDRSAPYAVKLAAIRRMEHFPMIVEGDSPENVEKALFAFSHFVRTGSGFSKWDPEETAYDKLKKYNLENYESFFMDFDRLLEHPEIKASTRILSWIKQNSDSLIALSLVVGTLTTIPIVIKFGTWIAEWFKKEPDSKEESTTSVPQSGNQDGKSKAPQNKLHTLNARLKALVKPQMGGPGDNSGEDILIKVKKTNFYSFYTYKDGEKGNLLGNLTFVCGRIFTMPLHFAKRMIRYLEDGEIGLEDQLLFERCRGSSFPVFVKDFLGEYYETRLIDNDIVISQLPNTYPNHRDIRHLFVLDKDIQNLKETFMIKISGHPDIAETIIYAKLGGELPVVDRGNRKRGKILDSYVIKETIVYEASCKEGDCGSLLFQVNSASHHRKILGMHVAGDSQACFGVSGIITQEMIEEQLSNFNVESTLKGLAPDGQPDLIPNMNVLGNLKAFTQRNLNSTIIPSPLNGTLIKDYTAVANLKPRLKDGVLFEPMKLAYSKYGGNKTLLDDSILTQCTQSYFELIMGGVKLTTPRLLTIEECIHGIEEDVGSSRINPSTSAGHPMTITGERNLKREYFQAPEGSEQRKRVLKDIEIEILKVEALMGQGIRPDWYYQDNGKDERLNYIKAKSGKTRLFSGCPFLYLLLVKKYFGAFLMDFTKKRIRNGSTLGVNVYSTEWDSMVRYLAEVGGRLDGMGAGDYAHYDGDHIPQVEYCNLKIMNMWYRMPQHDRLRSIIFEECIYSFHVLDGTLVEWTSGMPSGNPLTALLNTMYNNIIFRYAWHLCGNDVDLFNHLVRFLANGDDNLSNVHDCMKHRFTPEMITLAMSIMGMTYTDELKTGEVMLHRNIDEVQFLKRTFRYDDRYHRFVAPLDLDVVKDIINWTRMGPQITETVSNNMAGVIRELSLHGKDVFDANVPILISAYEKRMVRPLEPICYWPWKDVYERVLSLDRNIV